MKMQKFCYICKEKFEDKYIKDKSIAKLGTIFNYTGVYRGAADNICNLKYSVSKKIL